MLFPLRLLPTLHACFSPVCVCFPPSLAGMTCRTLVFTMCWSPRRGIFFHPAVMLQYARRLYGLPLWDQELGWAKKRPRRFGAPADAERPEHFKRSNVAFLRVSRGLGARVDRLFPASVCLFHDIDGWCYVFLAGLSCVGHLAGIFPSSSGAPVSRASLVWMPLEGPVLLHRSMSRTE